MNKIIRGLREALRVVRGETAPAGVLVYSQCDGCGNFTATNLGRCVLCHDPKPPSGGEKEVR